MDNLESLLGESVVRRCDAADLEDAGGAMLAAECVVCFAVELDGRTPDFTCSHCGHTFHTACLMEVSYLV